MTYRITKNGRALELPARGEDFDRIALTLEDVRVFPGLTATERDWILRSVEDLEDFGSPILNWSLAGNKWTVMKRYPFSRKDFEATTARISKLLVDALNAEEV